MDRRLGKYLLKAQLGQGGMGVVYLATDTRLKRDVALKILPRQLSANKEAVDRFIQEARVVAQLSHPNVVVVHDVDQEQGYCYLVMELLTGGTMQQFLEKGPLPWHEATSAIAQACRGLAAAQDAGLIHRDIKPSNLMKSAGGVVKLTDFGLAKVVHETADTVPMTRTGVIMGTPHFMSPEQCRGEPLDNRCDLYALGATYFALLVGRPPFVDAQTMQVMFAHCSRPTPDPCKLRPEIPSECGQIVLKAMAKKRADRFASARDMLAALDKVPTAVPSATPPAPRPAPDLAPTVRFEVDAPTRPASARAFLKRPGLAVASGVVALLLVILLTVWVFSRGDGSLKEPAADGLAVRLEPRALLPVGPAAVRAAAFAPNGRSVFSASLDGSVQEWDVRSGKVRRTFDGTRLGMNAVAVSTRWLAVGGQARTVWLWRRDAQQPPTALPDHVGEISALAFSPDGWRLAVGTYAEVRLYEIGDQAPRLVKVLGTSAAEPNCYMVMSVAFSSDSRWLATTTWTKKRVFVWKAEDGVLRHTSPELTDQPMSVAFFPGQVKLAIGLQQRGVVRWEPKQPEVTPVPAGTEKPARALAITPDAGTIIVAGEWGGNLRILDARASSVPRVVQRSTGTGANTIALSADGTLLVSGGGEEAGRGYLHLFDVTRKKAE